MLKSVLGGGRDPGPDEKDCEAGRMLAHLKVLLFPDFQFSTGHIVTLIPSEVSMQLKAAKKTCTTIERNGTSLVEIQVALI